MAAIGLVILSISVVIAILAPIVFPFDPLTTQVGGSEALPEWVMNFPDGYYLSKNMVVINDPSFNHPAALQEFMYTQVPSVSYSWSSHGYNIPQGSLQISSYSSSPVDVRVTKAFHYPFHGPPKKFLIEPSFAVIGTGVSPSQPILVRFFIDRVGGANYTLWTTNMTSSGTWHLPLNLLVSDQPDFKRSIGIVGRTTLGANAVIFPTDGDYVYGFEATFHGQSTINVDNLGLAFLGTAYGVLGTDALGADLLAQNMWGTRISLLVGLVASFLGIGIGLIVGLIAGYKSGLADETLMRFTDMILVIPVLPLLIVLIAVLGASIYNLILVIGLLSWMGFARVIRSQVLSLKERSFIEAAKASGAGTGRILARHIFPNIVSLTYVNLALTVPAAILTEAALSFLGLGDPTTPSWGHILNDVELYQAAGSWWWVLPPGIAIALLSLSFVLMGYALDEIFNPRLRRRR
jgi:ABC-type dipeptide/oligopeptide/nickel transport system permease subunit